jgi:hypothetical protein
LYISDFDCGGESLAVALSNRSEPEGVFHHEQLAKASLLDYASHSHMPPDLGTTDRFPDRTIEIDTGK